MTGTDQPSIASRRRHSQLTKCEIHDVLRNKRRTRVLEHLQQTRTTVSLRELSEQLAVLETGETPPPRNIRESVYNSLHQTHLPKLDELEIVAYETKRKVVTPADRFRQVSLYMEVVAADDVPWATYYLTVGIVALLAITLSSVGAPVFDRVSVPLWVMLFGALFALSALYQRLLHKGSYFAPPSLLTVTDATD
jgi:gamma-glutamylcyclotransferase (GGCT)/AIG2-like uncharacterized protein YtfP